MTHDRGGRTIGLGALTAATFFIVSGGPYGTEEIVRGHGYAGALVLLLLVPVVWSLPVGLLVGELGAALPHTGGFTVWVTRGLGRFWGLQEGWLSAVVGLIGLAIYPTLMVGYLSRIWPAFGEIGIGGTGWWACLALVAACTAWNALGIRVVGQGSETLGAFLLAPFALLAILAVVSLPGGGLAAARQAFAAAPPADASAWIAGVAIAMWNYTGFDNAGTFAAEVEHPQRNYPLAMLLSIGLITLAYSGAVLAASASGMPPSAWQEGSWVDVARALGGDRLAALVALGAVVCAAGMFLAALLSWSRLAEAMAIDGWLPPDLARRTGRSGTPTAAVVLGGTLSALFLGLGLRRLVEIYVLLYGIALMLEFAALVALRVREPALPRPFRVPGGVAGCVALAVPPAALLGLAGWMGRDEPGAFGLSALQIALVLAATGPVWWALVGWMPRRRRDASRQGEPSTRS
ncbi:MAG TPA: APC family permease [Anaeromyxobacteraceae bacterium]|nr:APC family permease [Anaeromyxobacteraceae bacterium]